MEDAVTAVTAVKDLEASTDALWQELSRVTAVLKERSESAAAATLAHSDVVHRAGSAVKDAVKNVEIHSMEMLLKASELKRMLDELTQVARAAEKLRRDLFYLEVEAGKLRTKAVQKLARAASEKSARAVRNNKPQEMVDMESPRKDPDNDGDEKGDIGEDIHGIASDEVEGKKEVPPAEEEREGTVEENGKKEDGDIGDETKEDVKENEKAVEEKKVLFVDEDNGGTNANIEEKKDEESDEKKTSEEEGQGSEEKDGAVQVDRDGVSEEKGGVVEEEGVEKGEKEAAGKTPEIVDKESGKEEVDQVAVDRGEKSV